MLALVATLWVIVSTASGCQPPGAEQRGYPGDETLPLSVVDLSEGERLRGVAATSIAAVVVGNVGGDLIAPSTLLRPGTDLHALEPTPQDVAPAADAYVVFTSGAGLEVFLGRLLKSAGDAVAVVPVSQGIELLAFGGAHEPEDERGDGANPHTRFDPESVIVWLNTSDCALCALDADNAGAYKSQVEALHAWIEEQAAPVPETNGSAIVKALR